MSLDMFGGGYLSCQESKSGNIKRLLLRFVVEKVNGKICVSCLLADTDKRSEVVWLVTNGHVSQGVPRWERGHSLTPTLMKGFFHFTLFRGELRFCGQGLILE